MAMALVRAGWILAAVLAGLCLVSILYQPVGWGPRLIVAALAVGAAFAPDRSLIVLAGIGPLSAALFGLSRTNSIPLNFGEALTLAFLLGFAARRAGTPRRLAISAPIGWSAGILLTIALGSALVDGAMFRVEHMDHSVESLVQTFIARTYLVDKNALTATMIFVEGIAVMVIVAHLCAGDTNHRDRVLSAMVLGASGAAVYNIMKIVTAALRREDFWQTFLAYFATLRVNVHYADLNAAGSYFAMMLLIAISFVPRARVPAMVGSLLLAAALWLTGSRTALGATLLVFACAGIWGMRAHRHRRAVLVAYLALGALVVVAGWKWYPQGRNLGGSDAFSYRVLMAKTAIGLIAADPVFGVGLGRFYTRSGQLENAHNNYLQIGAELGVPALVAFLFIAGFALLGLWRNIGPPGPAWGLTAGLLAFLFTCLAGHPLLVSDAAYPFWIALGLAIAAQPAAPVGGVPRYAALVILSVLVATLPLRIVAAVRDANVEHSSVGFSRWQQDADGTRYRWAGGRSSFFVDSAARAVRIQLRRGSLAPPTVHVRIFLDGVEADRVALRQDDDSRTVRLVLARRTQARFARVDLAASMPGDLEALTVAPTASAGVLMVTRPIVEP